MGYKHKGQLVKSLEWAKHFKKWGKRHFWSRERMAEKKEIKQQLKDE